MFRLQTDVSRLRADVNRIGGLRDTVDLRHKVCAGKAREELSVPTPMRPGNMTGGNTYVLALRGERALYVCQ